MNEVKRTWATLTDFVSHAVGPSKLSTSERSSRRPESGSSFYGTANIGEAERMAFNWRDGAERVSRMKAKVSLGNVRKQMTVQATRKAPGRIDMGRVMQGHPYGFQRVVPSTVDAPGSSRNVVDIFLNACVSAGVSTHTIEQRGAAMLALADALEQAGRRVRITVGMKNGRGCGIDYRIVVKQPGQPLNLNSVAFSVAHPSFFRRFIFSAMERENATTRRSVGVYSGGGYGQVAEFTDLPKGTIYMGGAHLHSRNWDDANTVRDWIRETMADQGIVLSD